MSIIDFETADMMFTEFADNWRIKTDTSKFKPEDVDSFEQAKERIIDAYMDGRLENIDSKTLEYTFAFPEDLGCTTIKIRRPRGATYMEADSGKKDDAMKKMFYMIAEMTGKPVNFYSKVDGVDIKTLTAISTLFFSS